MINPADNEPGKFSCAFTDEHGLIDISKGDAAIERTGKVQKTLMGGWLQLGLFESRYLAF